MKVKWMNSSLNEIIHWKQSIQLFFFYFKYLRSATGDMTNLSQYWVQQGMSYEFLKCSYGQVTCRIVVPVTSSLISTSPVFLRRRTRAGIPPQFFRATLFSSLALPYTRFLRAPHALRWTSLILWSSRSTRSWMPPCLRIWRSKKHKKEKLIFSQ